MMLAFIRLLLDRCGDDDMMMYRLYGYVKSFPSKRGIRLMDDESAFGHLFNKKAE